MALSLLVLALSAAFQTPAAAELRPAQRIERLAGLDDVALVAPGIYRGGTPSSKGVQTLATLGVKTIVNLRHYHHRSEEKNARKAGITYVWLPIASSGEPSPETLRKFLEIVQNTEAQPVYVHCLRGKDRTGSMIAAYRVLVESWPLKDAVAEMQDFGFFDGWVRLRRWVDRLEEKR